MPSAALVAALEAAVAAAPDNVELRLQLAIVQLEAGRPHDALENAAAVLAARPDDGQAASVAGRAATVAGDEERATRYGRLADALGFSGGPGGAAGARGPTGPGAERCGRPGAGAGTGEDPDESYRPCTAGVKRARYDVRCR